MFRDGLDPFPRVGGAELRDQDPVLFDPCDEPRDGIPAMRGKIGHTRRGRVNVRPSFGRRHFALLETQTIAARPERVGRVRPESRTNPAKTNWRIRAEAV